MNELITRAQRGDSTAMGELLATVAPSLQRFGMLMCRDRTDAEDVLQDALISIANHLSEFEGRSSFSSWAFMLARSACSRRRRGLKNQPAAALDELAHPPEETSVSPEQHTSDIELAAALNRALASLPEDYREAIILRDVEEMTAPEAAESLGITVQALKSRLHRARNALRDALKPVLEPSALKAAPSCPDVLALWSQKLEGDLSTTDCAQMERHIATCQACSSACSALKNALLACRTAKTDVVAPEIKASVQAAVNLWIQSGCSSRT
jgi:RNA polymerase sigma-70 factor (ECF subfamily)